jgi:hypothetical protein
MPKEAMSNQKLQSDGTQRMLARTEERQLQEHVASSERNSGELPGHRIGPLRQAHMYRCSR